jgi:hypothetical protein
MLLDVILLDDRISSHHNKLYQMRSYVMLHVDIIETTSIQALKLIMLDIPSPAYVGESLELICSYDLGDDRLYSIKW